VIETIVGQIQRIKVPHTFNPFSDRDEEHDLPNGPEIRTQNLRNYIEAMERLKPRIAFIAEAPGYRGMRRTGVPLSSEALLPKISEFLGAKLEKATKTKAMSEITAKVVWDTIFELNEPVLLWNTVMVQPTAKDDYHNRSPRRSEVLAFRDVLKEVLYHFRPEKIFAVGRVAEKTLKEIGTNAKYVRHPAHGGARIFRETVQLYCASAGKGTSRNNARD